MTLRRQQQPCRSQRSGVALAALIALLLTALPSPCAAWQAHFGSSVGDFSSALAVAIDGERNVIAGGETDVGSDHGFATVVKLAPDGSLLWRTTVDPRGSQAARVFVHPSGDVIVGGRVDGQDELDDGQPSAARLAGATGAVLWRHSDPASLHVPGNVLVDRDGNVVIANAVWRDETHDDHVWLCRKLSGEDGSVLWQTEECDNLATVDAAGDLYLAPCGTVRKLSGEDGRELWRASVPSSGCTRWFPRTMPIAVDPAGDVIVTAGDLAAKLSGADGALAWTRRVRALSQTRLDLVTTDAAGDVLVAGFTTHAARGADVLVAKLDGKDGRRLWQRRFDGQDPPFPFHPADPPERAHGIAVDPQGDVVVTAWLHRRDNRQAVIKLGGARGRRLWLRPVDWGIGAVACDPLGWIALAGSNHLVVNEWHDRAFGFWVGQLSPSGDGFTPTTLY